jgi:tRNA uridine 5-carboxymethylaminomethyl modification enzyme
MKSDIIVIGGGHAGIEAAAVAAKYDLSVTLLTMNIDLIGQMSCNPAVGGIAKGNIVREVDALGGVMGRIADEAGIQFRMLNKSKGIAVWGNRAQEDKKQYRSWCRQHLQERKNLNIFQGSAVSVGVKNGQVCRVETESGQSIEVRAVILCMGTFLNGTGHIGQRSFACGRLGEPPSMGLSESIQELGIKTGRLKTGTPARIDGRTVDYSAMHVQNGDAEPWPFSYFTVKPLYNRAVCWEIKTTAKTHKIILDNLDKSALYGGKITGIGPRYCPSIEDKLVKFGERDGHTLFLEPEGLDTDEMYLNGLSTSLPFDIQQEMVQSLPGFEKAKIIRPAYAIEYDFFLPVQLYPTLESRIVQNLYFAGQINGTSGYEEAACQGIVAGINAAEKLRGGEPFVLGRETSYTGVLIDDLITKGTDEPYRMFTSRAEYRLLLRQDNADERLMPRAFRRGLITKEEFENRQKIWEKKAGLREKFEHTRVHPDEWRPENSADEIKKPVVAKELLKRPGISVRDLGSQVGIPPKTEREVIIGLEADIKYEGFIRKQECEIERQRIMNNSEIPRDMNYNSIPGLLNESRMKLNKIRPLTLGQASRISGVTPADISILIMHVSRHGK